MAESGGKKQGLKVLRLVFPVHCAYYYHPINPESERNQVVRFNWSEEQRVLRATLEDFLAERHSFEKRWQRLRGGPDLGIWKELAELGILGLPFAPEYGGSD